MHAREQAQAEAAARQIAGGLDGGYLLYGGWEMPQAAQGT